MARKMRKVKNHKMSVAMKKAWRRRKGNVPVGVGPTSGPVEQPDTIYIALNGKIQCFKLRTMQVYVPADELTLKR